jgi:hypothetical protein
MDLTSTLKGESFRPMATVIAPGALALAPFAALAYSTPGAGRVFWDTHPVAAGVALFILSLALGLVCENLGSRVESFIDGRLSAKDADHEKNWHAYLLLTFEREPIGQRYLRTILFRLKFELAILGSLPFQVVGWLLLLGFLGAGVSWVLGVVVGGIGVFVWFLFEAYDSAKLPSRTRRDLVGAFARRDTA